MAIRGIDHVDLPDPDAGIRRRGLQRPGESARQGRDRPGVEQAGPIGEVGQNSPRFTVCGLFFVEADVQVERGGLVLELNLAQFDSAQVLARPMFGAEPEEDLEQRHAVPRPNRVHRFDDLLERHVLVGERGQVDFANALEQVEKSEVPRRVGAKYQAVREIADQIVQRLVRPACDDSAERQVGAVSQSCHQSSDRGVRDHEHCRAGARGQPGQSTMHGSIDLEFDCFACGVVPRTVIEWQAEVSGRVLQRGTPVVQLLRHDAARFLAIAQQFVLPQRVVRVLHGQLRPARRFT
ncbi:hypothetical protein A4R44_09308 [Amycolatopsis sp. M39]|nr:hypothetical protein A4R44_09308 [Amycolatopsis sp. M39]